MTTQHTSGPWRVNEHRSNDTLMAITTADGASNIGLVYRNPSTAVAQANARLIAAAPELLEALEQFLAIYPDKVRAHPDVKIACEAAQQAIAKAKGQ